jgi:hypothetical protein
MGFKVWCDLTKLIGGETFWDKAEDAIRNSEQHEAISETWLWRERGILP